MIDREQVLYVARLARLELRDDEVDKVAAELSSILAHIERIAELDLDEVAPTSYVVAGAGTLRPDEPRPSLAHDVALASAPAQAQGGFLVPSPTAGADPS